MSKEKQLYEILRTLQKGEIGTDLAHLQILRLFSVLNSIAIEYAEFCVRCDREKLPLLCLEDYIKKYGR
jgi:hypothetical protein